MQKKDSNVLKDFIQTEHILVEKTDNQQINEVIKKYNIHKGESSIIVLARYYNVDYCLSNEIKVRNVIKSEGFKVVGTLGIILKAFNIGKMSKVDCINLLKDLQINSKEFRFHPKLINKILNIVNSKK